MIVTRVRQKPKKYGRYILPIVAVVLLALALILPPSRNYIVNGPLAPVWGFLNVAFENFAKPFHFAALNNEVGQRDSQIAKLQAQLAADKDQIASRDKQII